MQIDKPQAPGFNKTQPSQKKIPVEGQTELHSEQPSQDLDSRKEHFGSHRKLNESSSELSIESDLQVLESHIQQVKEDSLVEKAKTLPDPNTMQRVRSQVQLSQTIPLVQTQNLDLGDLGLNDDETRGLKQNLNKAMLEMGLEPKEKIQEYLSDHLKPLLKELSKAEKQLIGSQKAKEDVNKKAQQQMIALMQSLGNSDELSLLIRAAIVNKDRSGARTALRQIIAGLVGELREGKPQTYQELSEKKKTFVDFVIAGIQDGIKGKESEGISPQAPGYKSQPTALSRAWDNLENKLKTQLGQLSPGQLTQLKLKTDQEIEALFLPVFGKSSLLTPLVLETVRQFTPPIVQRSQETTFKALTSQDLLGLGVQESLQALTQNPGNPQARGNVCDALLPHITDLLKEPNSKMQLQMLGKNGIAYLLKSLMPNQEGDTQVQRDQRSQDVLWLTAQIQNLIPQNGNISPNTVTVNHPEHGNFDAPAQLTLNGKTYEAQKVLNKAGFGVVFCYSEVGNPNHKIAVKVILKQGKDLSEKSFEARQEIIKEINLHSELQGENGHSQVVGFKGTLNGPDDSLYMVQEFASGGMLSDIAKTLEKARDEHQVIRPEAQRLMGLYMVKQGLEGLQYMHEDREMLHLDIKPYNLMLGNDGNVKMIDFGTAHIGTQRDLPTRLVDNPIFLAPEHVGTGVSQANTGSDIWGMGTVAYRLLIGDHEQHSFFHEKGFLSDIDDTLIQHSQDVNNRFMNHSPSMPEGGPSETDKPVFDLINSLMAPTLDQRPSAKQALQHEVFQDERLNSPELKRVFEKLAQPFPSWCLTPESQIEFSGQSPEDQLKARMRDLQPELQALGLA
jgi:serine/threonine protein kinase